MPCRIGYWSDAPSSLSYVVGLHNSVPGRDGVAEASVPWSRSGAQFTRNEIPYLIHQIHTVLRARAWHAVKGPAWAQPLPVGDEISPLLGATGAMCLLGNYSCSLMMMSYDYLGHPSFFDYGCGVMAHPHAPDHIRDDPELRCEFPPRNCRGWVAG